jgi:hypothetical protein
MTDTIEQLKEPKRKAVATKAVVALAEKHGGTITPEIILDDARRKKSPLHGFFCWDNNAAAEEYRKIQASAMIRRIKVTITPANDATQIVRVRAFVNVHEPDDPGEAQDEIGGHGVNCRTRGIYVTMEQACKVTNYRDQMIAQCKRDIESFRAKYSALSEAATIIESMDGFVATYAAE